MGLEHKSGCVRLDRLAFWVTSSSLIGRWRWYESCGSICPLWVADERVHSEGVWLSAQTCHVGFRWSGGMRGEGSRLTPPCCEG